MSIRTEYSVLEEILLASGISAVSGIATGGTNATIIDNTKDFEVGIFNGMMAEIKVGDISYIRTIISNTRDTITINTLPGDYAGAIIGDEFGGEVTILADAMGSDGNNYLIEVVEGIGVSLPMTATLVGGTMIQVILGTDDTGALDGAKNTATAIAFAINEIEGFSASMTGPGGIIAATAEFIQFSGGIDVVEVSASTVYKIKNI